jgi:hypothetical protein
VTGASAADLEEAGRAKQAVRERVWTLLERERVARFPGATGRIPKLRRGAGGRRPAGLAPGVAGGPRGQEQP